MDPVVVDVAALEALLVRAFLRLGLSEAAAGAVAATVAAAERDGAGSHGLLRLPGYAASIRSGYVDGRAVPAVTRAAPAVLAVDARNGFAQPALAAVREEAMATARELGLCSVSIRDSHHFAALWPDIEPFAEAGLVALSAVTSRPYMTGWEGAAKIFGTNPLAFAFPRPGGTPVVWDQASSLRAQGEVLLARRDGHAVPPGTGVDAAGVATTDPARILDGGALSPAGGSKGANLALLAEVLVGALGGAPFGIGVDSTAHPGAQTSRTGQFVLLLDPARMPGGAGRVGALLDAYAGAGVERLPSDRRQACRARSLREGVRVPGAAYAELLALAG